MPVKPESARAAIERIDDLMTLVIECCRDKKTRGESRPLVAFAFLLVLGRCANTHGVVSGPVASLAVAVAAMSGDANYVERREERRRRIAEGKGGPNAIFDPMEANLSRIASLFTRHGIIANRKYVDDQRVLHDRPGRGRIVHYFLAPDVLAVLQRALS